MSSHSRYRLNVHVGPYVKVAVASATVPTNALTCTNPSCVKRTKPSKAKFCDECGTKIDQTMILSARRKSVRDVLTGAFEDRFYVPGEPGWPNVELLIPNMKGPRRFEVSDADGSEQNLMKIDLLGEVEWLERTFSNELTALRGVFLEVQVCWGAVGYWP